MSKCNSNIDITYEWIRSLGIVAKWVCSLRVGAIRIRSHFWVVSGDLARCGTRYSTSRNDRLDLSKLGNRSQTHRSMVTEHVQEYGKRRGGPHSEGWLSCEIEQVWKNEEVGAGRMFGKVGTESESWWILYLIEAQVRLYRTLAYSRGVQL
jgi:hypothetical protein